MFEGGFGTILEVVIGMSFVYFGLALAASAFTESVAQGMSMRGKTLRQGIEQMIGPFDTDAFYQQPTVKSLSRDTLYDRVAGRPSLPSYIGSQGFAAGLLDLIRQRGLEADLGPEDSESDDFQEGIDDIFRLDGNEAARIELQQIQRGSRVMASSVRVQMQRILRNARVRNASSIDALADVEAQVASWFDATMDRVSGWYRRKVQLVLLIIGLASAFAFNVDSVALISTLYNDPETRITLVQAAIEVIDSAEEVNTTTGDDQMGGADADSSGIDAGADADADSNSANGDMGDPSTNGEGEPDTNGSKGGAADKVDVKALQTAVDEAQETIAELEGLGFPVGWDAFPKPTELFVKIPGLMMTGIAISFGAPFWFELLSKFINLRRTGSRPDPPKPQKQQQRTPEAATD